MYHDKIPDNFEATPTASAYAQPAGVRRGDARLGNGIDADRNGAGYYRGLRLAPPGLRWVRGLLTWGALIVLWLISRFNDSSGVAALTAIVSWVYALGFTWQTAKRNNLGGLLTRTRVVSVKVDEAGEVHAFYPSVGQHIVRFVLFFIIDAPLGWLKVLISPRSRSLGDTLAGTVVIYEGQIVPERATP